MYTMRSTLKTGIVLLFCIIAALHASPAAAQTEPFDIFVNSTEDIDDPSPGDGICNVTLLINKCTLRAAITTANAYNGDSDLVYIHVAPGIYTLTIPGEGENLNSSGDLDVSPKYRDIVIEGDDPGNPSVINGNHLDRVFDISGNTYIELRYLVIRNGQINNLNEYAGVGGGIKNSSDHLTLNNVVVESNLVTCSPQNGSCQGAVGGGIINFGSLKIFNSTIRDNYAYRGGGIFNAGGASEIEIWNSTISGNGAYAVGAINAYSPILLINSTISGNVDTASTGGVFMADALLKMANVTLAGNRTVTGPASNLFTNYTSVLRNSIIADPGAGKLNCNILASTVTTQGINLSSDSSCKLNPGSDIIGQDPRLSVLANWGGSTWTRGLLLGSPAINAGDPSGCKEFNNYLLTSDQRGVFRPVNGCDIGAFEGVLFPTFLPLIQR